MICVIYFEKVYLIIGDLLVIFENLKKWFYHQKNNLNTKISLQKILKGL
jgi:hypothetical protein